jgi:hypothetical protein
VQYNTYVRSRLLSSLLIDKVQILPKEAYTSEKLSIDYIRVFGLVAYLYVSPKSLLIKITSKKLLDSRVEYIFLGFSNKTTKQHCVYRLDLGYVVMSSIVDVDEEKQGGSLDLKICRINT